LVLDNASSHLQDLNLAHLNIQFQYLYNSTIKFMQPLTTSRGITYTTVSTVSQMHLKMRPLLVSVLAGDYSSAERIVNMDIYESMDKMKCMAMNGFWQKLQPEGVNDY
jgi:hypothetical protein